MIGLEHYATASDADTTKVRSFQQLTPGLTYPLCMGASATRLAYQAFSTNGTADFSIVIDQNGIIQYRGNGVDVSAITSVIDGLLVMDITKPQQVPDQFLLEQNYPNPFNPSTTIRYSLPELSDVRLTIYNILGQQVRVLVNETQSAGVYTIQWNGHDAIGRQVATGVYLYRLQAGKHVAVRKMIFAK